MPRNPRQAMPRNPRQAMPRNPRLAMPLSPRRAMQRNLRRAITTPQMALHRCRAPYHRHSTRLAKAGLPIRPPQAKETSRTTVRSRTWPPIQIPRTVDMSCPTTAMRAIHNSPKMGTAKVLMETKAIRQLSMHKTPMEAKESPIRCCQFHRSLRGRCHRLRGHRHSHRTPCQASIPTANRRSQAPRRAGHWYHSSWCSRSS